LLTLTNITKDYKAGDSTVQALKGVSLSFRKSEFVAILGPSGCGKTTMLNIIGGLDRYTDGDLSINGKSTKLFKDRDWDTYRNHSVGFVFQNYNLIPHQTVLANVELALTLTGVSKAERRRRAIEVLNKVGLGDQLKKKPTQMSGGQMQRVAIARALVNDPDILLADEPTGALDSETSVQIMEILKEIAKDRLIIMVTHNPELAETYANRIIRLLDGRVLSDSRPMRSLPTPPLKREKKQTKPSMSFFTALSLSLNNLMTKKARTFLTAFGGSIGIIGIALILSLSNGIQNYIDKVQEDTLSTYPLTITAESVDMGSLLSTFTEVQDKSNAHDRDKVYANTIMSDLMDSMVSVDVSVNNLSAFKKHIENPDNGFMDKVSDLQYVYDTTAYIYDVEEDGTATRINPSSVFDSMMSSWSTTDESMASISSVASSMYSVEVWQQMIDDQTLMDSQYELIAGKWPVAYNDVVLVVDQNNEVNDLYLYCLNLKDPDELSSIMADVLAGKEVKSEVSSYSYDTILSKTFRLVLPTDYFEYVEATDTWVDRSSDATYMNKLAAGAPEIHISGIIRPREEAVATSLTGAIGYTHMLTEHVVRAVNDSEIVKAQLADPDMDVFTGLPFDDGSMEELTADQKAADFTEYVGSISALEKANLYEALAMDLTEAEVEAMVQAALIQMDAETAQNLLINAMMQEAKMDAATAQGYVAAMDQETRETYIRQILTATVPMEYEKNLETQLSSLSADEIAGLLTQRLATASVEQLAAWYDEHMPPVVSDSTYEDNCTRMGLSSLDDPSMVNIYASSFDAKDEVIALIDEYNDRMQEEGKEEYVIRYTDYVGLIMTSVSKVINIISYVLIAFVAISLVVSSIMIGIITYISVLERTKEIGVLRSIGASKRDISRVFNAETLIEGLISGALGIGVSLLICIPANAIVNHLSDIPRIAQMPPVAAVVLIAISMTLTLLAGLIPSRLAAKKDPVEALRSE